MRRHRGSDSSYLEHNVWPAVTDTMILMASIFIVLSVVSMVALSRKIDDSLGKGEEAGEKIVYVTYKIEADVLFRPGEHDFRSPREAESELLRILKDASQSETQKQLKNFAKAQKAWQGDFYLVIEVAGHADSDPLNTAEAGLDNNWDLSARRSITVVHTMENLLSKSPKLKEQLGFSEGPLSTATQGSTIIRAAGYSNHLPAQTYASKVATKSEKDRNRRVEIRVFAQPSYFVKMKR